jgi:UDP-N-acetyl-D-mannosaminuronate dehydrogenase
MWGWCQVPALPNSVRKCPWWKSIPPSSRLCASIVCRSTSRVSTHWSPRTSKPGACGSCFPRGTLALVRIAQEHGAPSRLVEGVVAVNDARKAGMAARVIAACRGSVRGKTIAVLGLTFKPETDDMRDAPSLPIVARLVQDGAILRAFDPKGMDQARTILPPDVTYCRDALDAATGADALVLVTEWNEFRALSPAQLASAMRGRIVIDLRNVYDPVAMRQGGFSYHDRGAAGPGNTSVQNVCEVNSSGHRESAPKVR